MTIKRAAFAGLVILCGIALSLGAWALTRQAGVERLAASLSDKLTVTDRAVTTEIERFRYLPGVLAQDPRIQRLADRPSDPVLADIANRYLERVRDHAGADEIYVMDETGLTVAASNWNRPTSFVGHNYRFRPYFLDAIAQGEGRFYAVGVTTGKPGYFLSTRLQTPSGAVGVAVVKVDMGPLEETWRSAGERTGVSDYAGVVFLSGREAWKYRPLDPLGGDELAEIERARQYAGIDIAAAEVIDSHPLEGSSVALLRDGAEELLMKRRRLEPEGWQIFATASLAPVAQQARLAAIIAALAALLAGAVALYLLQRRQILQMRLSAHEALERRVAERTEALAREVEERKRAEAELRATQENLIQTAKLAALGRMSTAIVHEVSQPLSAMENTLATTGLLAERGRMREVRDKVVAARDLVRRMQRTIRHLKSFARRETGGSEPVDPSAAAAAAVELVAHRARDEGVTVTITDPGGLPPVRGNAVRLEQVVLNLVVNALDAVKGSEEPFVNVALAALDGAVEIVVEDNGNGIDEAVRDRITEPFFTTKETGEGLGLGLAISRAIVEALRGSLSFAPRPGGGSVFRVRLPASGQSAQPVREAAE